MSGRGRPTTTRPRASRAPRTRGGLQPGRDNRGRNRRLFISPDDMVTLLTPGDNPLVVEGLPHDTEIVGVGRVKRDDKWFIYFEVSNPSFTRIANPRDRKLPLVIQ